MIVAALTRLATNAAVALLLRSHATQGLAVKGHYMEVIADTVGGVGVLIASMVTIASAPTPYADVVVTVLVALWVTRGHCRWPRARCRSTCPKPFAKPRRRRRTTGRAGGG